MERRKCRIPHIRGSSSGVTMAERNSIVIVGGGHAGAQLCGALAAAGRAGDVHLVCGDAEMPYHRPPLSKGFLKDAEGKLQWHRAETWYRDAGITVHSANAAVGIDRDRRLVHLSSGDALPYDTLVLATGARARRLPHLPESLSNVAVIRTAADAARMRELLNASQAVTVIGGGFIGLEI